MGYGAGMVDIRDIAYLCQTVEGELRVPVGDSLFGEEPWASGVGSPVVIRSMFFFSFSFSIYGHLFLILFHISRLSL